MCSTKPCMRSKLTTRAPPPLLVVVFALPVVVPVLIVVAGVGTPTVPPCTVLVPEFDALELYYISLAPYPLTSIQPLTHRYCDCHRTRRSSRGENRTNFAESEAAIAAIDILAVGSRATISAKSISRGLFSQRPAEHTLSTDLCMRNRNWPRLSIEVLESASSSWTCTQAELTMSLRTGICASRVGRISAGARVKSSTARLPAIVALEAVITHGAAKTLRDITIIALVPVPSDLLAVRGVTCCGSHSNCKKGREQPREDRKMLRP